MTPRARSSPGEGAPGEGAPGEALPPRASHATIPHTADVGFVALAADLPALFREAAVALAEIAASIEPGAEATIRLDSTLEAEDLPSLAFGWLDELIALGDVHHAALVSARVREIGGPAADDAAGPWRLRGEMGLRPYAEPGVHALRQPKAATYHGLVVERAGGSWTLRAFLDL